MFGLLLIERNQQGKEHRFAGFTQIFFSLTRGENRVAVRLDALPEVVFEGEISYIGKLCHLRDENKKSRQKVFDVEVRMLKSDLRLKPGMTVS